MVNCDGIQLSSDTSPHSHMTPSIGYAYMNVCSVNSPFYHLFLHLRYGRFMSEVSYFLCYDRETIKEVFQRLRHNREVKCCDQYRTCILLM